MFYFILLIIVAIVIYMYHGYANNWTRRYVAPALTESVRHTLILGEGLVFDIQAIHVDNTADNAEQNRLANEVDFGSLCFKVDNSITSVVDTREYRTNARDRLTAANNRLIDAKATQS